MSILEEPASSAGTMSSLQNLDKELSFTNQFLVEKSQEDEPDKSNTKAEVQIQSNLALKERLDKHRSRLYKLENLNIPHQVKKAIDEVVTDAVDWAMQAPLRARFSDLPTVDMKEIRHIIRILTVEKTVDVLLTKESLDLTSQPPPLPPPVGASGALGTSRASGSTQLPPPPPPPPTSASRSAPYATPAGKHLLLAKTGDMMTFLNWYCRQINKSKLTQADLEGQAYEVVKVFYPDIINCQFQYGGMPFSLSVTRCSRSELYLGDSPRKGDQVRINVNRPLPLGGPPGHVTIQTEFFFNKDLEYLRFGNKGACCYLSISKMKDARYPDFGLELLVLEHMWIEDVCTYDISAKAEQALLYTNTRMDDQILPINKWVPIGKRPSQHHPRFLQSTFSSFWTLYALTHPQDCTAVSWMSNGSIYTKIFLEMHSISLRPMITIPLRLHLVEFPSSVSPPSPPPGKKKTIHLLIPNVRFTKLIIHHLRTKHNIHPRTGLTLYYSHEESVLNTLQARERGERMEHGKAEEEDVTESPKVKATKSKTTKPTKPSAHKASKCVSKAVRVTKQRTQRALRAGGLMSFVDEGASKTGPVYGVMKEQEHSRGVLLSIKDTNRMGMGKEKVSDEQVALNLLTLQTPKKKSPAEHISSRGAHLPQMNPLITLNLLYCTQNWAKPWMNKQLKKGGPNPGIQDEGQAGSNPRDAAESQPHSSHAGPNLEHWTENLEVPTEDQVILEEPASSAGTMSSLQNLDKELSFTNQFLVEKFRKDEPDKSILKQKVQSMVTVSYSSGTLFDLDDFRLARIEKKEVALCLTRQPPSWLFYLTTTTPTSPVGASGACGYLGASRFHSVAHSSPPPTSAIRIGLPSRSSPIEVSDDMLIPLPMNRYHSPSDGGVSQDAHRSG
ncbi:hypothetical protein Tco_0707583 [Tanacetum coccineum]|uniref:Uncharacterized protein n=1 Tax=Tanacetum coccineum TaxID=301880 RepID=A0ABQ4YCU3_9ASTR